MNSGWNAVRSSINILDSFTETIGKTISWLNLLLVFTVCLVVILRYLLNIGSIAMQESAMYFHALIFLGASAYTLKHDDHVRVDVFYRKMSRKQKALVNSAGTLLLLMPVCLFIGVVSWEYISDSWSVLETSRDPGGIPFVYLLKTLIMVMVVTLLIQGAAELLRSLMIIFTEDNEELNHG